MNEKRIVFDHSKLKGKMKEKNYTQESCANDLKINKTTLNFKLNGKKYFSQNEIFSLAKILDLSQEDISLYFFTLKV